MYHNPLRRLQYIWNIGLNDLNDALIIYEGELSHATSAAFATIKNLQIVLFVVSLALCAAFIILVFRPFLFQACLPIA